MRGKVREPLAGELRLQWWTDAIEGEARGDVRGHPVAAALIDAVRRAPLSRGALTDMLEARRTDLYDEPLDSLAEFAARADRIEGARIALAVQALLGRADPAATELVHHAGRAVAVIETLRAFASTAMPMHMTLPLELLRRHGIGAAEILVRRPTPAIRAAVADLVAYGTGEVAALRAERAALDPQAVPAFLPSALSAALLARAGRRGFDPFAHPLALPAWRAQLLLWRAARRGGVG